MTLTEQQTLKLFHDWSRDLDNATRTLRSLECVLIKYPKYPGLSHMQKTALWNQVEGVDEALRTLTVARGTGTAVSRLAGVAGEEDATCVAKNAIVLRQGGAAGLRPRRGH